MNDNYAIICFKILLWLYGCENFSRLLRNGSLVSTRSLNCKTEAAEGEENSHYSLFLHTDDNAGTCLRKHSASYRFYEMLMNEDESVCVFKEVHVNQNSNSEVIADVINRRSRSG